MRTSQPVSTSLTAKIIRTDGTVVDLGCIAYYHRNPFRRWAWRVGQFLRRRMSGHMTTR